MDLSFLGQPSKQLFYSTNSEQKENQADFNYTHQKGEVSSASLLLESIKHKQSQRLKLKMEREIAFKQDQISQLTDRFRKLQREEEKAKNKVLACQRENKTLSSKVQLLQKEIETVTLNHKQTIAALKAQSDQFKEKMKETIQSLQVQNQQLKNNVKFQTSQHEIVLRRIKLEGQQTTKELQAKILIKERQLAKVQQALEDKKNQVICSLNQKDLEIQSVWQRKIQLQMEINSLSQKVRQYEEEVSLLQSKTNQLQAVYYSELTKFEDEIKKRTKAHQDDINLYKVTLDCIEQAIKALVREFSLKDSDCSDLHDRLDDFRIQLRQKYKQSKDKQQFNKVYTQVQRYRVLELQLRNKINILQEELDFTKLNNTKNQNVAELIKEHLDSHQQTLIDYKQDKIKNFQSEPKSNRQITIPEKASLHQQIQSLITQAKQNHNTDTGKFTGRLSKEFKDQKQNRHLIEGQEHRPSFSKKHSKSSPKLDLTIPQHSDANNQNLLSYSLQSKLQTPQRQPISQRDQNQFLTMKNELTCKKKSLIYLMYKREQNIESALPVETKKGLKKENNYIQKQRSNSMGQLVRRRCQQHLL